VPGLRHVLGIRAGQNTEWKLNCTSRQRRDIRRFMRYAFCIIMVAAALSFPCAAQEWELGAAGGYGWHVNPSIISAAGSIQSGFDSKGVMGVVFGQNMYEHIGGELRWIYQFGGPHLKSQGVETSATGYSNLLTYDVLFHMSHREAKLRPYVSGGAGIKVYTDSQHRFVGQPFFDSAILVSRSQVVAAISAGGGLKYQVSRDILLRFDFRTYFTPAPDEILRPVRASYIHGWMYNLVPLGGISFVF
jgi:hypothetical protein